jgi:predicted nucleic acid-binding protein
VVLVDSTVWIDWLRGHAGVAVQQLTALLDEGEACLAPVVLQELLQGARNASALRTLRRRFTALPILASVDPVATHVEAAEIYARCRWAGVTPRSPHDCLVAAHAIEHGVALLHNDVDFERIAAVERRLKLMPR